MPSTALPAGALYAGHDAGIYQLPDDLLALRAGHHRLRAELGGEWAEDPPTVERDLVDRIVDVAGTDKALPDAADLLAAIQRHDLEQTTARLRLAALDRVADRIRGRLQHDDGDELIRDVLAPALNDAVKAHHAAYAMLRDNTAYVGGDLTALLSAPPKIRQAVLDEDAAVQRYTAIRRARADMFSAGHRAAQDAADEFGVLRNAKTLHPHSNAGWISPKAPWPTGDTNTFLRWCVDNAGELWMPTTAEQNKAYDAEYGEKIRDERTRRQQARALAGTVG